MEYSDNDAHNLLTELVKYAEALAADHTNPELTVKELVDDLVQSSDRDNEGRFGALRDRIYDGLNNAVGQ